MSLLADVFYLGANAKVQAVRFALCLALGLAAGIIALLYLRKARPVERALTDFFATVCIGGLFIVCLDFFLDGKFELYGLTAFALGIIPIPLIARKLLVRRVSADGKSDSNDKNETSQAPDDNDAPYEYESVAYEKPEDDIALK